MAGGNSQGNYIQDELGPATPSAVISEAMLSLAFLSALPGHSSSLKTVVNT